MPIFEPSCFQLLPWDTSLFGFPVASVSTDVIHTGRLQDVVEALRCEGIRLAYVSVPWSDTNATAALAQAGVRCVDRKVRYRKEAITGHPPPSGVESVLGNRCTPELEHLALASGAYSRFRTDPAIPREVFEKLYVAWIRRSIAGEIAQEVLVIHEESACAGMVTIAGSECGSTGLIGLIAVREERRGKGYGKRLMLAAETWCATHGMTAVEVVTQKRNVAACGLYSGCGYEIVRDEAVFHIWPECSR